MLFSTAFWRTTCNWRLYRHGSTYVLILSWANIMKQKTTRVAGKLSVAQKSKPAVGSTLHHSRRWHFIYFYTLLFFSKKPSFYVLSSVDWIVFATVYLPSNFWLSFDVLRLLKFIQGLYVFFAFLIKTSKILIRFNVLLF